MKFKGDVSLEEAKEEPPPPEGRFSDNWLWRRGLFAWLFALILQALASLSPPTVEHVYSNGFYFFLVRLQAILNGLARSFAIAELLFWPLALLVGGRVIWLLWQRQFKRLFRFLFWLLGVGFATFLVLWGLNYQREPLALTMDLPPRTVEPWKLDNIGQAIVSEINNNHREAFDLVGPPNPNVLPIQMPELYDVLEQSFQAESMLGWASTEIASPPKPLSGLLSGVMTTLGLSGVYVPYTGEATYNRGVPPSELPFVIAHEKAHQRGYAREDEADFVAFLTCIEAAHPYVNYSGYLYAMRELAYADPEGFGGLRNMLEQGPAEDLQYRDAFWTRTHPTLNQLVRFVNNAHLRANRVPSGIDNYHEDAALIVRYLLIRFNLDNR